MGNRTADIREILQQIGSQAPPHHFEFSDPFWVLITTILSHRTRDEVTDSASRRLFERYGNADGLAMADPRDVESVIARVGFYRVKAKRIIQVSRIIIDRFGGRVPETLEDLVSLPGVGRKTANVVLSDSMGIPAIAVDTHVQRISRRFGWSRSDDPAATEKRLMKIIPRDMWVGLNPMLVEFGKTVCRPVRPRCEICRVNSYCRYFSKRKKS